MVKNIERNISSESAGTVIYFLAKGSFLGIATSNIIRVAKTSSYISSILGAVLGMLPLWFIMYILKNTKGEGIIDTICYIFGKTLGTIINIIIALFFLGFSILLIYNFISFVNIEYMPETSKTFIACFLYIAFSYILSKGIQSLCKACQIILYFSITIFLISLIGSVSSINISNLMPIFEGGTLGIFKGMLIHVIFSCMPLFLITLIGKNIVIDENKYTKSVFKYYIIANIVLILLKVIILTNLGINIASLKKYPEYVALTQVKIFDILERMQNIFSVQQSFNIIILSAMSMMYSLKLIEKKLKNEKTLQILAFTIPFIVLIITLKIFKNITTANMIYINILPYVLGIFVMTMIILICIRIKYMKMKNNY